MRIPRSKRVWGTVLTVVLFIFSLPGMAGNYHGWKNWIWAVGRWLSKNPETASQWTLFGTALVVGLWSWDVHKKAYHRLSGYLGEKGTSTAPVPASTQSHTVKAHIVPIATKQRREGQLRWKNLLREIEGEVENIRSLLRPGPYDEIYPTEGSGLYELQQLEHTHAELKARLGVLSRERPEAKRLTELRIVSTTDLGELTEADFTEGLVAIEDCVARIKADLDLE